MRVFFYLENNIDYFKKQFYIINMNDRNWGGKREGAGRRKKNVIYKTFSVSLPEAEYSVLEEAAKNQRMTISRFISKYLSLDTMAEIAKEREVK